MKTKTVYVAQLKYVHGWFGNLAFPSLKVALEYLREGRDYKFPELSRIVKRTYCETVVWDRGRNIPYPHPHKRKVKKCTLKNA